MRGRAAYAVIGSSIGTLLLATVVVPGLRYFRGFVTQGHEVKGRVTQLTLADHHTFLYAFDAQGRTYSGRAGFEGQKVGDCRPCP